MQDFQISMLLYLYKNDFYVQYVITKRNAKIQKQKMTTLQNHQKTNVEVTSRFPEQFFMLSRDHL